MVAKLKVWAMYGGISIKSFKYDLTHIEYWIWSYRGLWLQQSPKKSARLYSRFDHCWVRHGAQQDDSPSTCIDPADRLVEVNQLPSAHEQTSANITTMTTPMFTMRKSPPQSRRQLPAVLIVYVDLFHPRRFNPSLRDTDAALGGTFGSIHHKSAWRGREELFLTGERQFGECGLN